MDQPSTERRDLACLEALYDAPSDDEHDALATLTATGLEPAQAQEWLLEARAAGLVASLEDSLVSTDRPTRQGRAIVEEARRRRGDRSHIRRTAQRRLLSWADDTGGGNLVGFLGSEYAWIDGTTLTLEQAAEAAQALHQDGLIKAHLLRAWGADVVRADIEMLPPGRVVIDEYNGDPVTWRASIARRDTLVNIEHNSGAVAIGSNRAVVNANVTHGIDAEALGRLVEALVAARGTLGLAADVDERYDANLGDLMTGDPGRVERALRWFGRLGRDIGANALGGILAAQALALIT
ncbi:MAG: hypothetical protein HGA44_08800 [Cellulomonadaceae bacterium]|nr:hypothetical protein [Cellulomonadaceae bacterium]